jgi:BirA family transcriptional regulator, biotin operon repressor / biotin---[acetyl-CoA-carboxylase] ligase
VYLGGRAAASGYRLEDYETLGSTNDEASSRFSQGDQGRLWIVARDQTKGRGRLGRSWVSPPGNLYASLLLIDPAPPELAAQLGFVAGVALIHALRDVAGPAGARIRLKWPNDALVDGAKLSGLLLEGGSLANGLFGCVIGFGVNCLSAPPDLPYPTASLRELGAESCDRAALFAALSDHCADWLDIWARGENFAQIRAEWLANAGGLGGPARVSRQGAIREGIFDGIDAQGRMLLVRSDGVTEIIEAGDVTLLSPPGDAALP